MWHWWGKKTGATPPCGFSILFFSIPNLFLSFTVTKSLNSVYHFGLAFLQISVAMIWNMIWVFKKTWDSPCFLLYIILQSHGIQRKCIILNSYFLSSVEFLDIFVFVQLLASELGILLMQYYYEDIIMNIFMFSKCGGYHIHCLYVFYSFCRGSSMLDCVDECYFFLLYWLVLLQCCCDLVCFLMLVCVDVEYVDWVECKLLLLLSCVDKWWWVL